MELKTPVHGAAHGLPKNEKGQFTTTCEITEMEETHLFESGGNFVTEAVLNNQKALPIIKNLNNNEKQR